jgi:YggT family protein
MLLTLIRYAVFAVLVLCTLAAVGSWLVRTRRVNPFKPLGRFLKQSSEPLIRPVEARVYRWGGNPVNAPVWLVVGVAISGVVIIAVAQWLIGAFNTMVITAQGGGRAVVFEVAALGFDILIIALFMRVIGSWIGVFEYNKWMRPAYLLTNWLVNPIRRIMPPIGRWDLSTFVALIVLYFLKQVVLSIIG